MSSHDAPVLAWSRGIAVVGLGLTAGYMSSVSLSTIKNTFSVSTLSPRDRLHLWSLTFDSGASIMIPAIPLLTSLLASSAYYVSSPVLYVPHTWVAKHRKAVLAFAAILTFANFPYTYFAIIPTVDKLKKIESNIVKESESGQGISTADTDYDIQRWTRLHHVRSIAGVLAFGLAVAELASA